MSERANGEVLSDAPVEVVETTKSEAESMGALAFFQDKYGERVRVVRAGARSTELCGGTHVRALGMIGPIVIVSEASIGSNVRRIEAMTGTGALARIREQGDLLSRSASLLRTDPEHVPEAIERLFERQKQADRALESRPEPGAPRRGHVTGRGGRRRVAWWPAGTG